MSEKDKSEVGKRNEEPLSYNPPGMTTDWGYNGANFVNHVAVSGDLGGPSCSSGSMVDSLAPTSWEHTVNSSTPLGFNEINVHNGASTFDPISMLKGGLFLPNMSGMLSHSLTQFPADSAFIERAARFSSFSGEHFGDMLNAFGVHRFDNPYPRVLGRQPQKTEVNGGESSKVGSPKNESMVDRFGDEAKQSVSMSGNESDEAEFSGGGAQVNGPPSSVKGSGSKKRKKGYQDVDLEQADGVQPQYGEAGKNNTEAQQKGEPNCNRSNGKHGKQSSEASDPPKEDYIHVRARRGQATNSHSLAERVRREKISERMKFLQDLVPGCSKVTGKAVMLDEIINYVQSLQRQVEFLSMKLATVNPRLDFTIEQLLAKDMFSTRAGLSTGLGFSPDMPMAYRPLHPTQPPIGNTSDALRRTINSEMTNIGGGFKEPGSQLPNVWEDDLHNVVQMGLNGSGLLGNSESCLPPTQMKAES